MLACQHAYLDYLKAGRTQAMTDAAKAEDKRSHTRLNAARAKPENAQCFDCSAQKPGWAVLPHGIFVCIECAQTHRHLGRHISQTKAINTGTYLWFPAEIAVMEQIGNSVAEKAFAECNLPPKPSRDAAQHERLAYAKRKYAGSVTPDWFRAKELAALPPVPPCAPPTLPVKLSASDNKPNPKSSSACKTPAMHGATRVAAPKAPTLARPMSPEQGCVDLISFDEVAPAPPAKATAAHSDAQFFAQFGL